MALAHGVRCPDIFLDDAGLAVVLRLASRRGPLQNSSAGVDLLGQRLLGLAQRHRGRKSIVIVSFFFKFKSSGRSRFAVRGLVVSRVKRPSS